MYNGKLPVFSSSRWIIIVKNGSNSTKIFPCQLLGDVGASILKIERPPKKCGSECETRGSRLWAARRGGGVGGGDDSRRFGPPFLPHSKEHLTDNVEDE